ncbi:MAG TPA: molybdopterin-dependent oxidoreductase [Longimicrobiales bacterium]|nr:molybdopterin-dependent oxidoreductase [Longimicrobiales bacterium]
MIRTMTRAIASTVATRRPLTCAILTALAATAPTGVLNAQDAMESCALAAPGNLVVYGDGMDPVAIPAGRLGELPRASFDGTFHDGRPARFEGVELREILTLVGVTEELHGPDMRRFVVVEATDGYAAVFALAELDPTFRQDVPMLADRQDGQPIREGFGPLQVIVPGDARQGRWVRQVECLRLERFTGTRP